MARCRILYVTNNHPDLYVGGAEVYSYELYQALRDSAEIEPILLARTVNSGHRGRRDTPFFALNDDPNQILWSQPEHDGFYLTSPAKEQYTVHFHGLLTAYRPHLVHVQHTIGLGVDLVQQVKRSLPATPVVYTLHEFLPICPAKGLMVRTFGNHELCSHASPVRCHECFPDTPPGDFFLRERFLKAHLRHVDLFLAPSRQLLERFLDWGIPRDRLRFHEYGRIVRQLPDGGPDPPLGQIGFFGQIRPHKGIVVLLQAMRLLAAKGNRDVRLLLSGAGLETEPAEFQAEVAALLERCPNVTFLGKYQPAEIPERMRQVAWVVVPSTWWENSPLVIQEAFMNRRPVICSDVGGMAEKVRDGVDGLHFRVGDAASLAAALERAAESPARWRRLRDAIRPVYSIAEAARELTSIYRSLLGSTPARP
jgi:glycosyltransferase involved in cell wall biosynthesis